MKTKKISLMLGIILTIASQTKVEAMIFSNSAQFGDPNSADNAVGGALILTSDVIFSPSILIAGSDLNLSSNETQAQLATQARAVSKGAAINPSEDLIAMLAKKYGKSKQVIAAAILEMKSKGETISSASLDARFTSSGTTAGVATMNHAKAVSTNDSGPVKVLNK